MGGFQTIKIGELVESGEVDLQTGPFGTQLKASDYVGEGTPVINVRNVGFGDIRKKDLEFLDEKMVEKLSVHQLVKGDIVFGRKGAVERHAFIDNEGEGWVQGSDCLRLRINSERINNRFVSYYLRTQGHQDWMQALCSFGATMASLNQDIVKLITIPVPVVETQNKIAAILAAYDDLIENNKRRIALLENTAEEVYREWFVRFRFPGYQSAEFEKGIPKGWDMVTLEKAFQFVGGGTPSKAKEIYWKEGRMNWYTPSDITRSSGIFMSKSVDNPNEEGISSSSAKVFPAYSIMMTSRATIGEIGINRTEASTNQGFITCIPNERFPLPYLYQWLRLNKDYFKSLCGGATFPEINKGTFKRIEIVSPPQITIERFQGLVSPLFDQIEMLLLQNENLKSTKEAVLPRLISGKLSVEELAIQFPPSIQDNAA